MPELAKVWQESELLLKVKEPAAEEQQYFRSDLSIFCFLHPAAEPVITKNLLKAGVLSFDYDLLMLDDGSLPILHPMSVIAGKLSVQCGARGLQSDNGGSGILLGGCSAVPPAKVLILGAGAAGGSAASVAAGMGADVVILDINQDKLDEVLRENQEAQGSIRGVLSTQSALESEIASTDLLIGAVLIPGKLAPKLITRAMLSQMRPGSVFIDICIDQGGCSETSRVQSLENPYFLECGVLHYAVPNMPALVPRTATQALTSVTLPWLEKICALGPEKAASEVAELRRSLVTNGGKLCNKVVAEALGLS